MAGRAVISPVRRYALVVALVFLLAAVVYVQLSPPEVPKLALPGAAGNVPIVSGTNVLYHQDVVSSAGDAVQKVVDAPAPHVRVRAGQSINVVGWAVDASQSRLAAGVAAIVDGKVRFSGTYGGSRADVAHAYNNAAYTQSGFTIAIPASALVSGKHFFQLFVLSADRSKFYQVPNALTIVAGP